MRGLRLELAGEARAHVIALYVVLGGAAGSLARFLLGGIVQRAYGASFPLGTLLVNLTGSFFVGLFFRYALATPAISPETRAFLTTGLCGGYTTFSTFSYESAGLLEDGEYKRAGAYVLLSVVLCIAGTFAGFAAARGLLALRRGV